MENSTTELDQLKENMLNYTSQFQKLARDFLENQQQNHPDLNIDPLNIGASLLEMSDSFSQKPEEFMEKQMNLWQDYMALWQNAALKMAGEDVEALITPEKGDRRFADKEWQENQIFDFIKQSYLLTSRWVKDIADNANVTDEHDARKFKFYTDQFLDAMSPTNFALTNPTVIRETIEQQGQNLLQGFENIIRDINPENGELRISMTDEQAFEAGRNVASTPGKVVYQNELIQLIQYSPTTEKAFATPLLIVPPWINKFYILDLRPENSLVKWLTDKGYTTFIISWRNPDEGMRHLSLDDYMRLGPLSAMEAIKDATGEEQINTVGYCIGGTLLSCTLAHLGAKGELDRIKSSTFLVTQVDFSEAGELSLFIDDKQFAMMSDMMEKAGYLDGKVMSQTFNMLRSNDLIWSFIINNYMLGRAPFPFDLLYWNSDCTRLTQASHTQYLKEMYLENNLVKPGKITMNGTPLDLGKITIPTYVQAGETDHICPWKSVYKDTQNFAGKTRFMLAGSGHIAGVVNPPSAKKYYHWVNEGIADSPDEWLESAEQVTGSWWNDWHKWLKAKSGKKVAVRIPGDAKLDIIEDAPGSYVKVRY